MENFLVNEAALHAGSSSMMRGSMHTKSEKWLWLLITGAILLALAACGGGGTGAISVPGSAPTGVAATPGNGKLTVSWSAVSGATSYKVYYGAAEGVTASSPSVTSTTTSVDVTSLSNNTPYYLTVAAVNEGGSSVLSSEACGVPSVGAAISASNGLTVWDPLCSSSFDGSKWINPRFGRNIQSGAAVLAVSADNLEPVSTRGLRPSTSLFVSGLSSTNRVTNLQAVVSVVQSGALVTGSAQTRAELAISYQPAANRLAFSGGSTKAIFAQVGIVDDGAGPQFRRVVGTCTVASCATVDIATGIVFTDNTFPQMQTASYDTPYTFRLALDETTRIFTFEVSGGALAGTLSGTADATALFTSQAVDRVNDISAAQLRVRVQDAGSGGGNASNKATFDNVQVGFNTGPAAAPATLSAYDDFSGAGGNSGPDFVLTKWTTGESSASFSNGGLAIHNKMTGTPSANYAQSIAFNISTAQPSAISADATITSLTVPGTPNPENTQHAYVRLTLYNDGSSAVPFNRTGDVVAAIALTTAGGASFYVFRCADPGCNSSVRMQTGVTSLAPGSVPFGLNTTHSLNIRHDPASHAVTFSVDDGADTVVDPTTVNLHIDPAAPYAAPPNGPFAHLGTYNRVFTTGENGALDGYFNNFMIKP